MQGPEGNMIRHLGLLMCLSIGVAGCASRSMMMNDANPAASKSDQAVVILAFPPAITDFFSLSVYDVTEPETKLIGILETGSKIAYPVPAGRHTFMILANSTDFLEAHVAAGKTYYAVARQERPEGSFQFHYALRPVRAAELDSVESRAIDRMPFKAKTDRADAWYVRSESSVRTRRQVFLPAWLEKNAGQRRAQTLYVEDGR
jgi:hypothetical protein